MRVSSSLMSICDEKGGEVSNVQSAFDILVLPVIAIILLPQLPQPCHTGCRVQYYCLQYLKSIVKVYKITDSY